MENKTKHYKIIKSKYDDHTLKQEDKDSVILYLYEDDKLVRAKSSSLVGHIGDEQEKFTPKQEDFLSGVMVDCNPDDYLIEQLKLFGVLK